MPTTETTPNAVPNYTDETPPNPYIIRGIPAPLVETFWHHAVPYIKRALDHANGEFTVEDFRDFCRNRDAQLWLVGKDGRIVGALTTEIVVYPRRKHLRVITLSGTEFGEWMPLADETVVTFARANGCAAVECVVRPGFAKRLEPIRYKLRHHIMLKELGDGP